MSASGPSGPLVFYVSTGWCVQVFVLELSHMGKTKEILTKYTALSNNSSNNKQRINKKRTNFNPGQVRYFDGSNIGLNCLQR